MNQGRPPTQTYVFGSSTAETERLQKLDQLLAACTRGFLRGAGIDKGMKVLDVGCGPGPVSFLVADVVGRTGTVVGIDRNPAMLAAARARGRASGHTNLSFVEADLDALELDTSFDAVVGRLILLHLRDPVAVVRKLTRHLRPGGIVAFQEPDLTRLGASAPTIPLVQQLCDWVRQAHQCLGVDTQFGLRLHQVFLDAGLPAPRLRCDAFVGTGPDWGWYAAILDAIRNALPVVVSAGIATAEEVQPETLAERLRDAVASQRSATRGLDLISAWSYVPSRLVVDVRRRSGTVAGAGHDAVPAEPSEVSAMARQVTTRPKPPRGSGEPQGDRGLRYAAIFFAAGLAIHTADHLRRGADVVTPQVLWGGTVLTAAGMIAIAAVLARHRLAPQIAIAVGLPTALSVSASHLLPHWSSLSDAFPGGGVDALSWAAVSVEIAGAIAITAAAVATLRRRSVASALGE